MNIAHIITGLNIGGAEKMLLTITSDLIDRGNRVTIIYLSASADKLVNELENRGATIVCFNLDGVFSRYSNLIRFFHFIRVSRFDVLHCHLVHALILGLVVRWALKRKVVGSIHSVDEGGGALRYLLKHTLQFFNRVIFVSDFVRLSYSSNGDISNGIVLNNFIDFKNIDFLRQTHVSPKKPAFCTVSRLEVIKEIPSTIISFSEFARNNPHITLNIFGEGKEKTRLRELVLTLGLSHRVKFMGQVNSVKEALTENSIFVTSCGNEGFGLSLLEAASYGAFCVAIDNPSHRLILEGSSNCYIYRPNSKTFIRDAYKIYQREAWKGNSFDYNFRLRNVFGSSRYMDCLIQVYKDACSVSK